MKKILVTGAFGSIGKWVLKYLLTEGKYEITALDLKTKESVKKLKKRKINIVYGNVEEEALMASLIKEHDYVIHLAGIMPPLCNLSKSFGDEIDYTGTENIVKCISFYNPDCFMIYPSATTLYEKKDIEISSSGQVKISTEDYFSRTKEKCEKLIKEKLKNYVIFRIPFVLGDLHYNKAVYLYNKNEELELITDRDAAYALVKSIEYSKELNKKVKILTGGKGCRVNSTNLYLRILDTYGYSRNITWNYIFKPYKYSGYIFKEDKKLEELLNYQNDSIDSYFMRLKRTCGKRRIPRILAKPLKKKYER